MPFASPKTIRLGVVAGSMVIALAAVHLQAQETAPAGNSPASAPTAAPTPAGTVSPSATPIEPTPAPVRPVAATIRPAPPTGRSTVVTAAHGVQIFSSPGGRTALELSGETELGAVRTLLVVGSRPGWWKVALPLRPNDRTGWVRSSEVTSSTVPTEIDVDRAQHRLVFKRNGTTVHAYPVAVGKSSTPTPAGHFFVTDNLSTGNPGGAYGPYALGLNGHSDVLLTFGSGDGVLGIHGTDEPGSIGKSVSHGCIRLRNSDVTALRKQVPLGTPVVVT